MTSTIIDSTDRLHLEVDKNMKITLGGIVAEQEIPDSFLQDIRAKREFQDRKFAADDVQIASLPAALVDSWHRNGFNIWDRNVTPQDIIARLMKEDLTAFLTTSKSFG